MAMIKCKGCEKEISSNAKVCPHCGEPAPKKTSLVTWLFLILLIVFGIGMVSDNSNSSVVATPKEEAKNLVKLESYEWSKGGFGNVLMADFKIKNDSQYTVKDFEITCIHYGKSGTEIDSNKKVIYESIEPSKTKKIKEFNMGFINTQANNSSCEITDFQI